MLRVRPQPQDLGLPLDRRVFEAKIQRAPPERIADPPLFVRGHHYKGLAFGLDRSEFRNADLPLAQDLKQLRLKLLTDFVDFIDQEHPRRLSLYSSYHWT